MCELMEKDHVPVLQGIGAPLPQEAHRRSSGIHESRKLANSRTGSARSSRFDRPLHGHGFSARLEPADPFVFPWPASLCALVPPSVMVPFQTKRGVFGMAHVIPVYRRAVNDIHGEWHERRRRPAVDRLQVENTGVEPVTSCMPCKRSSQLS